VPVFVRYMYPIYAEVDLDEGDVVRVVVDGESPSVDPEVLDDAPNPVTSEVKDAALRIAESAMWPSWDYGW
jgi:hypothetical protein